MMTIPTSLRSVTLACTLSLAALLPSCQQAFENDSPLYPVEHSDSSKPIVYFRFDPFAIGSTAALTELSSQGGVVTAFTAPEVYVYLSEPAAEDMTLQVAVSDDAADAAAYGRKLADGRSYQLIPSSVVKLSSQTVTFKKGQQRAEQSLQLSAAEGYEAFVKGLEPNVYAVAVLRLSLGDAPLRLSQDYPVAYYPYFIKGDTFTAVTEAQTSDLTAVPASNLEYVTPSYFSWETFQFESTDMAPLYDGDVTTEVRASPEGQYLRVDLTTADPFPTAGLWLTAGASNQFSELELFATFDGENWVSQGKITVPTDGTGPNKKIFLRFRKPQLAKGYYMWPIEPDDTKRFTLSELHLLR